MRIQAWFAPLGGIDLELPAGEAARGRLGSTDVSARYRNFVSHDELQTRTAGCGMDRRSAAGPAVRNLHQPGNAGQTRKSTIPVAVFAAKAEELLATPRAAH
jgi:hypothetical protein